MDKVPVPSAPSPKVNWTRPLSPCRKFLQRCLSLGQFLPLKSSLLRRLIFQSLRVVARPLPFLPSRNSS